MGGPSVAGMNTFNAVTSVVASHGEHDRFLVPLRVLLARAGDRRDLVLHEGSPVALPSGDERARDILAERFARGELTGEEYRERLEQLR